MHLDLIVGLPLDYWDDIKYSFEEVFKLFAPELQLGFLKFLKGTTMRDKEQHGYKYDPVAPYQIIESKYMSRHELEQVTMAEEALEMYWNKPRAINTLKYVTAYYSVFDFLQGLGNYFNNHCDLHKHDLKDVYTMLFAYAKEVYPEDAVLQQLITIDYYLQHKIKPVLVLLPEAGATIKQQLIEQHKLNHHKLRFAMLPVNFNWTEFVEHNHILPSETTMIIAFDGKNRPQVLEGIGIDRQRL